MRDEEASFKFESAMRHFMSYECEEVIMNLLYMLLTIRYPIQKVDSWIESRWHNHMIKTGQLN